MRMKPWAGAPCRAGEFPALALVLLRLIEFCRPHPVQAHCEVRMALGVPTCRKTLGM